MHMYMYICIHYIRYYLYYSKFIYIILSFINWSYKVYVILKLSS